MLHCQMKRMLALFLLVPIAALVCGCAHRYTQEEYQALQTELQECRQTQEKSLAEKARLERDLSEALKKLEQASQDMAASYAGKQDVLDKSIECMEENKALLKQIAKFKVLTQERKDAQWRLNKANDTLLSSLEAERMADQLYIVKGEDEVKIILPQRVLFPTPASAWLTPRGASLVKKIGRAIDGLKPLYVEVAGHTDVSSIAKQTQKNYATNWELGNARAVAVLVSLEGLGIKKEKLSAVSHGDTRPISDSATEEGRAMNRRVEIVITP